MHPVSLRSLTWAFGIFMTLAACGTTSFPSATSDADSKAAAVYADCDAQHRVGKLASYRQAVECARPQVLTLYAQAGYPYMDLVTFDLQERSVGAERIDFGLADAAAVQRDIGTLEQRLLAERERRV